MQYETPVLDDPGNLRVYAKKQELLIKNMMNASADRIEKDREIITELKHVLVLTLQLKDINKIKGYAMAALANVKKEEAGAKL